jgi:hypothetical protein
MSESDQPETTAAQAQQPPNVSAGHGAEQAHSTTPHDTDTANNPAQEPSPPSTGDARAGGQRVTRRDTTRHTSTRSNDTDETIEETIIEDVVPVPYQGPATGPAPVG